MSRMIDDVPEEMKSYDWVQDYENVLKNSRFVSGVRYAHEIPPTPLSLALKVIEENLKRPEIYACYASAPVDGQIGEGEHYVLTLFREYLKHKYGNESSVVTRTVLPLRRIVNGEFSGADDPDLHEHLLGQIHFVDDGSVKQ